MSDTNINPESMAGQWFGESWIEGSPSRAEIVLNVERRNPAYALLTSIPNQSTEPRSIADGVILLNGDKISGQTHNFRIYDPSTKAIYQRDHWNEKTHVSKKAPIIAKYDALYDGTNMEGSFANDLGEKGRFVLWRSYSEAKTRKLLEKAPTPELMTWDAFKDNIRKFCQKGRFLFRGQRSNSEPLRTSFHRTERNIVPRYLDKDISKLRHQINAISTYYYENTEEDLQGLLALAQHHGFPTPLLDWTESPYVAAFFAFDLFLTDKRTWYQQVNKPVRIFIFDRVNWEVSQRATAGSLIDPCLDVQFFHPPAHNNPRYYPQQSMAAFSNVDNIEDFVRTYESTSHDQILTIIDILAKERTDVEDELRFMGITPAALFPGIEGVCKSLRAERFS